MRYRVQFDSRYYRWVVVDSLGAEEIVGIHATEIGAIQQACIEESRWVGGKASVLGAPPPAAA